jgi:hypothetical protein
VAYRIELTPTAAQQIHSLPFEAQNALLEALTWVLTDPFDPFRTRPSDAPGFRTTTFDRGLGIVEFQPWDDLSVVVLHHVTWAG